MDSELAHSYLRNWIGAERAFRDDTLRYSLCGFDLDPLQAMLVDVNRRLKRSKAFDPGRVQGCLVAALDGIEVLSSYSRRCEDCLERRVMRKDPAGRKIEETQYYHRAVGCQMVHSPVKPFLDIEWLRPGEDEVTAALRLLARLPDRYGSRFCDILLLDALYAQTPVLELAHQTGWEMVISLKQNLPDLYQSAARGCLTALGITAWNHVVSFCRPQLLANGEFQLCQGGMSSGREVLPESVGSFRELFQSSQCVA